MIEAHRQENELGNKTKSLNKNALNKRGLTVGETVMVLTQIVMVAIMRMTPVHMKPHGHGLSEVGIVIGFHVDAMYLPSIVTVILVIIMILNLSQYYLKMYFLLKLLKMVFQLLDRPDALNLVEH